jgi:aminopeptidase-like protein
LAYADGNHDLIALADRINADALECAGIAERLVAEGLLERC